jgi:hypothetical protein
MTGQRSLHLVRDVLDKLVLDRDGRPMGRADSVTLTLADDGPPRLDAIVIGPVALARRVAPFLGRWLAALERWMRIEAGRPVVVPFDRIDRDDRHLIADVQAGKTAALIIEQVVQRWLARIPGSR